MMNSKRRFLIIASAFALLCAAAIGCSFIPFASAGKMGEYFSAKNFGYLGQLLSFQGGKAFIAAGVVSYIGIIFVLAMTLLGIKKKKGIALVLEGLAVVVGAFTLMLLSSFLGFSRSNSGALGFAIALALLAIVSALLPFCFKEKEEERKLTPLPSTIPSVESKASEEKKEEAPVEEKKQEEPVTESKLEESPKEEKPVEETKPEEESKPEEEKPEAKPQEEENPQEVSPKEEPQKAASKEGVQKGEEKPEEEPAKPVEEAKKEVVEKEEKTEENEMKAEKKAVNKIQGKYEVYPEAGFFKYRLKANNGEILIVSNGYKTRDGAHKGIDTLKKNVATGVAKIIIDKKGYGQFRIFTPNDSRLIVAGEFYPNPAGAQSALNSVEKFYQTDKIVDLEEIPDSEIREWRIDLGNEEGSDKGKFEIYIDEAKKFRGRLLANNGQLLFATAAYTSKAGVSGALEKAQKKFSSKDVTITCDKQGRYQFVLYADNGAVLVMGESYPNKDRAISAAKSSKKFAFKPTVIDVTKEEE